MMRTSQANLSTTDATRYIRRLCKHWSHKFTVSYDDQQGKIDFGSSNCQLFATTIHLTIQVTALQNDLENLQKVVIDHLQRFTAADENLDLEWQILNEKI